MGRAVSAEGDRESEARTDRMPARQWSRLGRGLPGVSPRIRANGSAACGCWPSIGLQNSYDRGHRPSAPVPRGFIVESVACEDSATPMAVRCASKASACPECGVSSERVHSRYRRQLADLSMAGRLVRLVLLARRLFCDERLCGRRVFTERFEADVLAPRARRTERLDPIVHHLGLALGGRPAATRSGFARVG